MAIHSSILAWKIPRSEEPDRLQSMGSQSRTRLSGFTITFLEWSIGFPYFLQFKSEFGNKGRSLEGNSWVEFQNSCKLWRRHASSWSQSLSVCPQYTSSGCQRPVTRWSCHGVSLSCALQAFELETFSVQPPVLP